MPELSPSAFAEMLAQAAREVAAEKAGPKILPEAAVMTLREVFVRYADQLINGPRFEPGDLITPVGYGSLKGAGEPHIVLEVRDNPEPFWSPNQKPSHYSQGMRLDIRVANFIGTSTVAPFWCESFEFENWIDKSETGAGK